MKKNRMKGQEVISVILISGILIGVVGSVYFWGVPLIQKNKDISTLENSEDFMRNLNTKIKNVANSGGRDQLVINVPGLVKFDGTTVELVTDTEGTIYAANAEIPLGRNACTSTTGTFGADGPETLCVKSTKISEQSFRTTYTLKYITLQSTGVQRDYQIALTGGLKSGSTDNTVVIENKGSTCVDTGTGAQCTQPPSPGSRALVQTFIEINII